MDVLSLCPLPSVALVWQPRAGAYAVIVICKATFVLSPGEATLADEQEHPNEEETHWDDDPARSLHSPSDLVPFKPRADVVLVGSAFSPRREPVRSLVARMIVGTLDKSIEVVCDRSFLSDGSVQDGPKLTKMPLRYERAAGGPETSNPVGVSLAAMESGNVVPLPNLQPVGTLIGRPGDRMSPVGFGPIASSWPGRADKVGKQAQGLIHGPWSRMPLPDDLDVSFFNAAPLDQQVERIATNERIMLENMSLEHPRLITRLPGLRPRAFVEVGGAGLEEVRLVCDTLWIDTDRSICTLTWRGQRAIKLSLERRRVHVLMEQSGQRLTAAEIQRSCASAAAQADAGLEEKEEVTITGTVDTLPERHTRPPPAAWIEEAPLSSPLPFMDARSGAPGAPPSSQGQLGKSSALSTFSTMRFDLPGILDEPSSAADASPPWLSRPGAPPPPPIPPATAPPAPLSIPMSAEGGDAAANGLLSASNAAANSLGVKPSAAGEPSRPSSLVAPAARPAPADFVELLWLDPAALEGMRRNPPWVERIAALRPRPEARARDDEDGARGDEDDLEEEEQEPKDDRDRREVHGVLAGATPTRLEELDDVLAKAASGKRAFAAPLVLAAGELEMTFDEMETLKATLSVVSPFTAADRKLKEAVDGVGEVMKTPWLEGATEAVENLTARVKEAFAQSARTLPAGYLDGRVERILLEQRRYRKLSVLGETRLRALLGGVPAYLPDAVANRLPRFARMRARVIAEVHLQQDQYESCAYALRVVALAREVPLPKGKKGSG